jgi:hypothetical protein
VSNIHEDLTGFEGLLISQFGRNGVIALGTSTKMECKRVETFEFAKGKERHILWWGFYFLGFEDELVTYLQHMNIPYVHLPFHLVGSSSDLTDT